jgi:hypothetical protein
MKILFYTTDIKIQNVYSEIGSEHALLCDNPNDLDALIEANSPCVLIMDFDCSELNCREVLVKYSGASNVSTVLLTGSLELSEIVEIQNSQESCDAYLTKPITNEIVLDIASDFELSQGLEGHEEGASEPVEDVSEELNFSATDSTENIDDLLSAQAEEPMEEEVEDEEEVDFSASEFKISTEVREVVDQHNQSEANFDDEVNQDIQRKFDAVFGKKEKVETKPDEPFPDLNPSFEETPAQEEGISFDLSEEENKIEDSSIESTEAEVETASKEVSMSDDNEDVGGLEFNLPEEGEEVAAAPEESNDSDDTPSEDAGGGLEFSLSDDDGDADSIEEALVEESEAPSEEGGLEFSLGEGDDLDLSDEAPTQDEVQAEAPSEEGGLDLGDDDSGGLSLSADGDEVESAPVETAESEEGGLDLGDDSADGLSLSAEGDEVENAPVDEGPSEEGGLDLGDDSGELSLTPEGETPDSIEEQDDGGLDFSATEETSEATQTNTDTAVESTDSFEMGGTGDIDATISSIVAAPEDSTGEFDMSEVENAPAPQEESDDSMQEFDYKTSSGFTPDLSGDDNASVGEDTNPTIIAQTGSLQEGDFLSDLNEATSTEENISNELNFSDDTGTQDDAFNALSDEDSTGETIVATDFNLGEEENVTQTVQTPQPISQAPQMSAKEELETLRSYDEDEMLRLQGTIRQLREEREGLMGQINELKSEKQLLEQDNLGLKAELDEVKIELGIVKKRYQDDLTEKEYQTKLNEEKKELYETKAKNLQKDFDRLNQKVRIDFNQVKQREKELESKLELAVMDSESQVQSRDLKILELKRKIDSLEFNMENSSIREQKHREDKSKLEERLGKIMKTLRGSIQLIEDDLDEMENDNTRELE